MILSNLVKIHQLMKKIGILGCGWLGFSLARSLIKDGYEVHGTSTRIEKKDEFEKNKITFYLIKIDQNEIKGNLDFFKNIEVLIICIPPGKENNHNYSKIINLCCEEIMINKIKNILFTSSISVYEGIKGEIDEKVEPKPVNISSKEILISEEKLMGLEEINSIILRLGGLIGANRNPIYNLVKKDVVKLDGRINLIHQKDCISIISELMKKPFLNNIFNCVYPYHPLKKDFYEKQALLRNLKLKKIIYSKKKEKTINSTKISKYLNYKFKFDINLLESNF